MAILYTTHYMEEAERLCDRVGIIDQGRIIAEGTRRELVALVGGTDKVTLVAAGDVQAGAAAARAIPGVHTATAERWRDRPPRGRGAPPAAPAAGDRRGRRRARSARSRWWNRTSRPSSCTSPARPSGTEAEDRDARRADHRPADPGPATPGPLGDRVRGPDPARPGRRLLGPHRRQHVVVPHDVRGRRRRPRAVLAGPRATTCSAASRRPAWPTSRWSRPRRPPARRSAPIEPAPRSSSRPA